MTYFSKSNQPINLQEAKQLFDKMQNQIFDLLYKLGDECDNIRIEKENLDQEFIKSQYRILVEKLDDVYRTLTYLSKPVTEQGFIKHNSEGRYALPSGDYFTSGSTCEILYNDERCHEQYWIYTSIEHNGEDYYATALGKKISIDGMMVRVRR